MVGLPHEIKGQGTFAYVSLTLEYETADPQELVGALEEQVRHAIGPIAKPGRIQINTPGLPKNRSGKIMRRILRKIAEGEYNALGNIATLADPTVVEKRVETHKAG